MESSGSVLAVTNTPSVGEEPEWVTVDLVEEIEVGEAVDLVFSNWANRFLACRVKAGELKWDLNRFIFNTVNI